MSWLFCFPWPEGIKKRACRYLLQRYLGQFLEEKLTLDQLTVDLYNGTGRVTNVSLDVQALNEMGEQHHLPLEFVDGFISEMSLSIPWSALLSEASYVEVKGLKLTIQPRQRTETGTSMFESMWSSMTSSMQLAQECLQQDANNPGNAQPLEGVELFAQTIDSILSRVKVRFLDTVIRLEHVPLESSTGVALELWIRSLEYSDEAGSDPSSLPLDPSQSKGYIVSAFTTKRFYLEGVTLHMDEFPSRARTFSRSVMTTSRGSTPDSPSEASPSMYTPPEKSTPNLSPIPILFAKLTGRQELRLKLKQGEVPGPKVELELTLGSFIAFLTPRQVHVLLELCHGLASPDLEDMSNVAPRPCVEKPMAVSDFSRVERELMHQLNPPGVRSTDLRNTQGWSTASLEDSDSDEFLPMKLTPMTDSVSTNVVSMDDSMTSTSSKSSTNVSRQHKHRTNVESDASAETSQFHVRVSSIAIVILHEDILTLGIESRGLTSASLEQLRKTSEEFFTSLGIFAADYGNKNFERASRMFLDACKLSHLRILAAPLVIEGSERTTTQASSVSGSFTLASLEIVECLIDSNAAQDVRNTEIIELLAFSRAGDQAFSNTTDFRLRFKYSEKAVRQAQGTRFTHPRTEVDISLEPCRSELDVTIVDRVSAVLNPQQICIRNPPTKGRNMWNQQTMFYQAVESPLNSDSRVDVKVSSSRLVVTIRFPVPDLRPVHDMSRAPWWTRSVRQDLVTLTLINAQVHTSIDSKSHHQIRHEVQCRDLLMSYTEVDSDVPIEIGRSQVEEKTDGSLQPESQFGWPRIVITIFPQHLGGPLEDSSEEEPTSSLDETLNPRHQPSPFSSKRVIHESDTPHSDSQYREDDRRDGEELVIPGSRQEMLEFMEEGTHGSRLQIEINLPCLSIQIPSKHLYEQIYNRINTDLFLWEPSAPRPPQSEPLGVDLSSTLFQESIYPKFSMCKSGIHCDSDADSDDGVFHSTEKSLHGSKPPKTGQTKMSLTLLIPQGLLSMYTPVRDGICNVIPGQQGEMILRVEDATIFCVNSYKGDANLGYVCTLVKTVALNHCGLITIPSQTPPLRSMNSVIPRHCQPAIYRSRDTHQDLGDKDMLTVAVRLQAGHQTHHIKTFRVAVGIRNATLRHRMSSTQTSWFSQFMDCLDVVDHPVAGYSPPGVLTELHLHLWSCSVDYRPLYIPLRSMLTLGSFSVSSNIAAKTNTSTLRFIAEDIALFISEKLGNNVDLKRDYVCVMDLGLFELSLRLNEKMCGGAPRVDLRASNNVLHIRTCADSGKALTQLLTYFANDGDLATSTISTESLAVPSGDEESLLGDESINTLSKSQEERVNSLMEEAMEDTVRGNSSDPEKREIKPEPKVEVFFFPDEPHPSVASEMANTANQASLETCPLGRKSDSDPDEDFCILGEEAGAGIMPRHGVPEVRWLSQDYVRVVDNHFSIPLGKTDLLKAPKGFPPAILRYTLCEMTLIWHMYGGKDFGRPQGKKHVTIEDSTRDSLSGRSRSAVVFSKLPNEIKFGSVPNSPKKKSHSSDWWTQGGPGRLHDVLMELQLNKVRFQHESYPEDTAEASRQVLLVSEIEIRDRLASSHINKFLYQYSSESRPRQTHANMFALKAVHMRPDPKHNAQECCLKLSVLPLRLNIDQDSLLFLIDFFTDLAGAPRSDNTGNTTPGSLGPGSKQGTPTHHPPVMSVNDDEGEISDTEGLSGDDTLDHNLMILLEDELMIKESKTKVKVMSGGQEDSQPIYFRSIIFAPEVLVRLDYHGKRVDLTHGPLAGLLMGLGQLNCSELRLKRLTYRHGLLGFEKLMAYLLSEWLQDIKKNQLPSLLGGVGPMHSLVQLFQGIRDLFWMPIEQYQKDGRIVRGLQRGANSFTTSTAMAALELTSRLVHAIQSTAETAYDMVSPGPSVRRKRRGKGRRKRYSQPLDIREGMANAYMLVKEGLGETANQLVRVASEEHEQKGVSGAVGGVLRQIPPTVVKPIILATEATSNVLGGMKSQLVPDARREAAQKWRQDPRDVN